MILFSIEWLEWSYKYTSDGLPLKLFPPHWTFQRCDHRSLLPRRYLTTASVRALLPRCRVCICSASLVSFKFCSCVGNRCCHFLLSSSMVSSGPTEGAFQGGGAAILAFPADLRGGYNTCRNTPPPNPPLMVLTVFQLTK